MKLNDLLKNISFTLLKGNLDTEINDIKYDSRKVTKNDMYIALVGYNSDGHDYIKDAIKKITQEIYHMPNVKLTIK